MLIKIILIAALLIAIAILHELATIKLFVTKIYDLFDERGEKL